MERTEREAQETHPGDDPETSREELELDLMEADASEAGEAVGEETD